MHAFGRSQQDTNAPHVLCVLPQKHAQSCPLASDRIALANRSKSPASRNADGVAVTFNLWAGKSGLAETRSIAAKLAILTVRVPAESSRRVRWQYTTNRPPTRRLLCRISNPLTFSLYRVSCSPSCTHPTRVSRAYSSTSVLVPASRNSITARACAPGVTLLIVPNPNCGCRTVQPAGNCPASPPIAR
jgi:hypothetical protein